MIIMIRRASSSSFHYWLLKLSYYALHVGVVFPVISFIVQQSHIAQKEDLERKFKDMICEMTIE